MLSTCIVKDNNSKYGTYVIRKKKQLKVSNTKGIDLKPNDVLKFGYQQHSFM